MIDTIIGSVFSIVPVRLFFTISAVVLFFVTFWLKMAVFAFLRNVTSQIEFLEIKIPEYSDTLSQQFFIAKASISIFVSCRKVALCQSGRMAHTPRIVLINVPIDRITPSYSQVEFQFSIINLTNRISNESYLFYLNSLRAICNSRLF